MVTFIAQPQLRFRAAPPADFSGLGEIVANSLRERALSKDLADAAAVDAQGGTQADVMRALAGGRTVEARESGLTGLMRARAAEEARLRDEARRVAEAAESARRFGITTDLQRERLDIAREAAQRTAAQPGFEEKERRKAEIKEEGRVGRLRTGGRRVLNMVGALEQKVGDPDSPDAAMQQAAARFESATGPIESTMVGRAAGTVASMLPVVGSGARENLRNLALIQQDAQAINSTLQRELLKGGGSISDEERRQINQILGDIVSATDAREARALLQNFRGLVASIFEMEGAASPAEQPQPAATEAIPPPPPGFQLVGP